MVAARGGAHKTGAVALFCVSERGGSPSGAGVSATSASSFEKTLTKLPRAGTFPTLGDASATSADNPTQPRLNQRSFFNLPTRMAEPALLVPGRVQKPRDPLATSVWGDGIRDGIPTRTTVQRKRDIGLELLLSGASKGELTG